MQKDCNSNDTVAQFIWGGNAVNAAETMAHTRTHAYIHKNALAQLSMLFNP